MVSPAPPSKSTLPVAIHATLEHACSGSEPAVEPLGRTYSRATSMTRHHSSRPVRAPKASFRPSGEKRGGPTSS